MQELQIINKKNPWPKGWGQKTSIMGVINLTPDSFSDGGDYDSSKKVLDHAIRKGGSSIKDFKNLSGKQGGFQSRFKVYQREGLKCKKIKCSGRIKKNNITNRSTFFCDSCQK